MVWIISVSVGGWLLSPSISSSANALRDPNVMFLAIGMLCCFFDLFTVPLVTLTVPLLGLYWKGEFDVDSPKLTVRRIGILSIMWLAGYSICWATKWVIVAMIAGMGVITELSSVIQFRIGGGGPLRYDGQGLSFTAVRSMLDNAAVCRHGLWIVAVLLIVRIRPLVAALLSDLSNKNWSFSAVTVPLVLFAMPLVWLAVVEQHSIWHAWFVARIYFSSFAIMLGLFLHHDLDLDSLRSDSDLGPFSPNAPFVVSPVDLISIGMPKEPERRVFRIHAWLQVGAIIRILCDSTGMWNHAAPCGGKTPLPPGHRRNRFAPRTQHRSVE